MTNKEFETNLALYGPRLGDWPTELRVQLGDLQDSPTRMAQLIEAQYVEDMLSLRMVEPPSSELNNRILRAARKLPQEQRISIFANLRSTLEFLIPETSNAFATMLVFGLIIGGLTTPSLTLFHPRADVMDIDKGAIL